MIRVQSRDFDIGAEIAALRGARTDIGAIVTFTGTVRDRAGDRPITGMELEHYPGMTEAELARIEAEAQARWPLQASLVVHRHGALAAIELVHNGHHASNLYSRIPPVAPSHATVDALYPKQARANFMLGLMALRGGRLDDALQHFSSLPDEARGGYTVLRNRALALEFLGRYDGCVDFMLEGLKVRGIHYRERVE